MGNIWSNNQNYNWPQKENLPNKIIINNKNIIIHKDNIKFQIFICNFFLPFPEHFSSDAQTTPYFINKIRNN